MFWMVYWNVNGNIGSESFTTEEAANGLKKFLKSGGLPSVVLLG